MGIIRKALAALTHGKPVFIHDDIGREDEVDMVFHASKVEPKHVGMLRKLAGGLICYVMPRKVGAMLGLKYMDEILRSVGYNELASKRLGYGDPPNFSLWVNHVSVKTGIRDSDRAKTIRELDKVVDMLIRGYINEARRKFYKEFMAPGHVPILLGRDLNERRGHTELSIALAELGGLRPSLVIAEMLKDYEAMSVEEAERIAEKLGTIVIEGSLIIDEWLKMKSFSEGG